MKLKLKNTKLVSNDKTPLTFFHSTPAAGTIESFRPLTHFGTEKASKIRTFHYVYQALNIPKPAHLPDELPKSLTTAFRKLKDAPRFFTYSVHLHMKSPIRMPDINHHNLAGYYRWFYGSYRPKSQFLTPHEWRESDVVGAEKIKYKKLLSEFIFLDPFTRSEEDLKKELSAIALYRFPLPQSREKSCPAFLAPVFKQAQSLPFELPEHVALGRMIRFLEGEGYDGFVYKNEYEDKGHDSYIIFRPQQVFDSQSPDTEHEIPALTTENQAFLKEVEDHFFHAHQSVSPTERIFLHNQRRHQSKGRG